jgi:NADPH:quinone reductase-like Zn-dependent oxidoreductase
MSQTTMRAVALEGFDRPATTIEVPVPTPDAGEVQVRVAAASVNAYDVFVAMGAMKDYMTYEFPAVIGGDLAGVVTALGDGVDGFAGGDRVFGMMGMKRSIHDGSFGEFATPQASSLAKTPDGVDDEQAATLGVAGTTAVNAVDAVDAAAGSTVLVLGASGGVGSFVVQLLAARGTHVIASSAPGDEDFLTGLGAKETVDYTAEDADLPTTIAQRYPDGLDGFVDLVNRDPAAFAEGVVLVKEGGAAASAVGGAGDQTTIGGVRVTNVSGDGSKLAGLADRVAAGTIHAPITRTYTLEDGGQALEDFANLHTVGKYVIRI